MRLNLKENAAGMIIYRSLGIHITSLWVFETVSVRTND